jgi:agmatinase
MSIKSLLFLLPSLKLFTSARDVTFPPVSGYSSQQIIAQGNLGMDITHGKFAGLMTYANLPYVHCLAPEGQDVEPFDIAILGAPFDTVGHVPRVRKSLRIGLGYMVIVNINN